MKVHVVWLFTVINLILLLSVAGASAQGSIANGAGIAPAAAVGTAFTYQGQLKNGSTTVNGSCNFKFGLWDAASGGTQRATRAVNNVALSEGLFTVQLDFGAEFNGDARWLEVAVSCPSGSAFSTLTPRQALTAAPYALRATSAGSVAWSGITGKPPSFADNLDNGVEFTTGNGLTLSNGVLSIVAPLNLSGSSASAILSLNNNGSGRAGYFTNQQAGSAALRAENTGNDGFGLFGAASGANSLGVIGSNTSGVGTWGESDTKAGVVGLSNSGFGVDGESNGNNGAGVIGLQGPIGTYPFGVAGVSGSSITANGTGIYGAANNGTLAYGVWGVSTSGFAGYFDGKVYVNGGFDATSVSSRVKNFKIDHPLDPANKYLYHASVESSDMKNIYDGVAVLDANGAAIVTLPDWFEALNQDFRYQLTAIGAPGPNLYIAQEIQGNRFAIAGGKAGMKISWQVTGIRHDPYAVKNPIQVEVDKSPQQRGKYLYPEGYGQPESKGEGSTKQQGAVQSQSKLKSHAATP